MTTGPNLNVEFAPHYGEAVSLNSAPLVRRITAENPSKMTFYGTNSYLLGDQTVAIIDPGPMLAAHLDALEAAVAQTGFASHILLTHHHPDHTDGVAELKERLGVPVFGPAGCIARGMPVDVMIDDGDEISGDGWSLSVVGTPGHTADHLCFQLADSDVLFAGDHVMGWSTSVIIPPDGSLRQYLESLEKVQALEGCLRYLPGHGDVVADGPALARAMRRHRVGRSAQIITALESGAMRREQLLNALYPSLDPALLGAASLSLEAHLVDLIERREVKDLGEPGLQLQR